MPGGRGGGGGPGPGTAASTVLRQKQRMSFKAAGQATLGFLSARRRLEDGLKCFSKRRQSRRESLCGDSTFCSLAGLSGRVVSASDCGVRGPRFESRR